MEHLADRGRDAWAFDLAGFGFSTRPDAMEGPPSAAAPIERARDGLKDLDAVVSHVLQVRSTNSLDLIGWSFGSVLAAMYAVERPERVRSLVLLGSMHGFDLPFMAELFEESPGVLKHDLPAYRIVTPAFALAHWAMMRKSLSLDTVSDDVVARVEATLQASDAARAPNIRQPTGPLVDLHSIWRNRPIYDAGAVKAATLVARGDHDLFADKGLATKLIGAPFRDEIVVEGATHWVLYEKKRLELIAAVDRFLDRST
jgi:pimeloyl-ACP methyl ester carboxylesterase